MLTTTKMNTTPPVISLLSFTNVELAALRMAIQASFNYIADELPERTPMVECVELTLDANRPFTIGMQGSETMYELYQRWCRLPFKVQNKFALEAIRGNHK
jgi:hypothetical protein